MSWLFNLQGFLQAPVDFDGLDVYVRPGLWMEEGGGAASGEESSQFSVRVAIYSLVQQHLIVSVVLIEVMIYLA